MNNSGLSISNTSLHILLVLIGGLGDYIVHESFYEKVIELYPEAIVDIQCLPTNGKPIYSGKKNIRRIIPLEEDISSEKYDISVRLEMLMDIYIINESKVERLAPDLYQKLIYYTMNWMQDKNNLPNLIQYKCGILLKYAFLRGLNRYSMLGGEDIFNLSIDRVKIDLLEEAKDVFHTLNLGKYITLNYGAATWKDGIQQVKVWPLKYYEQFIRLFKQEYPEYRIIQLGGKQAEKIEGVDNYFLGADLELIKYILMNSIIHLDCEGGLVHLATALGTRCAVLFGPTPKEYYEYKQNINITAHKCNNCMGVIEDWYTKCCIEQNEPECMYGILPDDVIKQIKEYL